MTRDEDLELTHALQLAPRASWRSLATVLHRSPGSLAQRWQELSDQGLAWCTAVPFGSTTHGVLVFVALQSHPGRLQELIEHASLLPEVITIEEPARNWDVILTVLADDAEALFHAALPRIADLPGLARHETIICTRLHFGGHEWRLGQLDAATERAVSRLRHGTAEGSVPPLAPEDRDIVRCLFLDGRARVAEIADQLAVHPSTISRRMNRILAHPALSLRCDMAPELVGQPISCQWFCTVPPEQHAPAAAALRTFPALRLCASTTGPTNFTFVLWVSTPEEIFDVERQLVERIPGLTISESSITVRFFKRMGWRLDARGRRTGEPIQPGAPA